MEQRRQVGRILVQFGVGAQAAHRVQRRADEALGRRPKDAGQFVGHLDAVQAFQQPTQRVEVERAPAEEGGVGRPRGHVDGGRRQAALGRQLAQDQRRGGPQLTGPPLSSPKPSDPFSDEK